jgi:hypothetical protein
MDTKVIQNEIDETTEDNDAERALRWQPAAKKIVGLIVAAVLIFLAQRDLRRRPAELVRGRVGVWKVLAMAAPGALAYLLLGRRRAAPQATVEILS